MTAIEQKLERGIVAAACQINGLTVSMPAPARHHDVMWSVDACLGPRLDAVQGFLDHCGVFVGREAALIVAHNFGQISKEEFEGSQQLFSEHLW